MEQSRTIRGMIGTLYCGIKGITSGMVFVLEISEKKLGLTGEGIVDVINVKCDPVLIGSLREQSGFSRHII